MFSIMQNDKIVAKDIPDYKLACMMARGIGNSWVIASTGGIAKEYSQQDVEQHLLVMAVLADNDVSYKSLSIYNLSALRKFPQYQVYCNHYHHKHNELYDDVEEAAQVFLEIKSKIK